MKNKTPLVLLVFIFVVCLLSGCKEDFKSSALKQHEATYPDIQKKYVYQSLIRLANVNKDPNFEKLIKDVKKIVIYLPPRNDSTYQIKALRTGLYSDGYELLIEGRAAEDMRMSLWVKEFGPRSHYLALVESVDQKLILEVDGQINIEYLMALEMADQNAFMDLIKQGF